MNYDFTQVFVPSNKYVTTGNGFDQLGARVLGVFTPTYVANTDQLVGFQSVNYTTGAPTPSSTQPFKEIVVAMGTSAVGVASKFGSFKSPTIKKGKVTQVSYVQADATAARQQVSYLGFDEVNDFKSPSFSCDEEYVVTIKIDEYWSKGIYQPMIQESVRVKTINCTECGGGCDALSCYDIMALVADKINANPLLSKYVTATHVFKGSAPTYKYILTLPDPGNSTAENNLLTALQAYYPSATYGTIAITTTDTDGDSDADALGNTLFEIATPVVAIEAMPTYLGVAWEKVQATAGSVTACGVKLEGKALDAFGNACVPDAVPYVFNLVRFQVTAAKAPFTTQDFDINDLTGPWYITKTQDVRYPIGAGSAMAELERHFFRNNLPNVAESVYYWNPIYNEDVNQYLYVSTSLLYNVLSVKFLDDSPVGFEKKSTNSHELLILVEQTDPNGVISTAGTGAVSTNIVAFFNYFSA